MNGMPAGNSQFSILNSQFAVRRRPHFRREDNDVRFLISRHVTLTLDDAHVPLFDALAEGMPYADAVARSSEEVLRKWHDAELIEFVAPRATAGRPLVAIEPHMDDVALSAGGRLLLRRDTQPIVLLASTRESNVSCYWSLGRDFFDAKEVTDLRCAESELAAEFAGASLRILDRPDAPLRFQPAAAWTPQSFLRMHDALAPFLGFAPQVDEARALSEQLAREVLPLDPAELWIPLGLGGHIDHRMTRDACLMMIADHWDRFASIPILLYEDHPYSVYFPHQLGEVIDAFAKYGVRLTPDVIDIEPVFEEKIRLVSVYASQFKGRAMMPNLRKRAEEAGTNGRLCERAHRLMTKPVLPPESELAPNAAELRALREELETIDRDAKRIAIIAGAAFGPWPALAGILLDAFPHAHFDLYVAAAQRWEIERFTHERIRVHALAKWIAEIPRAGTPAIIVRFAPWPIEDRWREQILKTPLPKRSQRMHALFGALLPARTKIFCRHLGDVCGLLAESPLPAARGEG